MDGRGKRAEGRWKTTATEEENKSICSADTFTFSDVLKSFSEYETFTSVQQEDFTHLSDSFFLQQSFALPSE